MSDESDLPPLRRPLKAMRKLLRKYPETPSRDFAPQDADTDQSRDPNVARGPVDAELLIRKLVPYPFQEG